MRLPTRLFRGAAVLVLLCSPARSQSSTELVSQSNEGVSAGAECNLWSQAVSSGGRYVVFWTGSPNLSANSWPGGDNAYLRDRWTGTTSLIAVNAQGTLGSGASETPAITPDGRFISFTSYAEDLVPGNANGERDVFVKDTQTGNVVRVSDGLGRVPGNGESGGATISADGKVVAFTSNSSNLVPGDTNGEYDTFVHDLDTGMTTRISVSSTGIEGNETSTVPYISADGRYVAFQTYANNLGGSPTLQGSDVLIHDRLTGQTMPVVINHLTGLPDPRGGDQPTLSADGRYCAFHSPSEDLVPGDNNTHQDVFVRDMLLGVTVRASVSDTGEQANSDCRDASISADGRYVAFYSPASNLVPNDTNGVRDIFVRDLKLGTTRLVSLNNEGAQGNGWSEDAAISPDGTCVAFTSESDNLIPGVGNLFWDEVYLRTLPPVGPTTYCLAQTNSLGCVPAIGSIGEPSASGSATFGIGASNLANQKFGLLFYSTVSSNLTPFGGSFLCVAQPVRRTPVQQSGGSPAGNPDCSGTFGMNFNAWAASGKDPALVPGQAVWAQYWCRDPGAASTTNLTDAITFVLGN